MVFCASTGDRTMSSELEVGELGAGYSSVGGGGVWLYQLPRTARSGLGCTPPAPTTTTEQSNSDGPWETYDTPTSS